MKYRAIFFDAAHTLMDLKPRFAGAFAELATEFGHSVTEAEVNAIVPKIDEEEHARLAATTDFSCSQEKIFGLWIRYNRIIFEGLGLKDEAERMAFEMERRFESGCYSRVFEDVMPCLERLRAEGYGLGIISNGTEGMLKVLEHLKLDRCQRYVHK